jgi:hypothetical protein
MGIVNGTTNFILTRMGDVGAEYSEVLTEAQRLGLAERDPTADVDGHDAAAKAAILAGVALGCDVVTADVNDFLQRLRVFLGADFPAAYVIEVHPKGHGLHVHVALQSRFIDWVLLGRLWGRGHVQYSDCQAAISRVVGKRAQARALAGYLSKYMAKGFDESHELGRHRYEVTQGFSVVVARRLFRTFAAAVGFLRDVEGSAAAVSWCSDSVEDWHGPPAWWFQFDLVG